MNAPRVTSRRFPYLPVEVSLGNRRTEFAALMDTGFEGELLLPDSFSAGRSPDMELRWVLAGGSRVTTPAYDGFVRIGGLATMRIAVCTLGDEAIIGRALIAHFRLVLDHGNEVILEL